MKQKRRFCFSYVGDDVQQHKKVLEEFIESYIKLVQKKELLSKNKFNPDHAISILNECIKKIEESLSDKSVWEDMEMGFIKIKQVFKDK